MRNKHDYRQGYIDGRATAKKIVNNDIMGLYGIMCVILKERYGFTEEQYTELLEEIQERWNEVAGDHTTNVKQYLEDRLPIRIVQELG